MLNFVRYVLALAVLASGFYGASRFRVTGPAEKVPICEEEPPFVAPARLLEPSPAATRPLPLAALIDTEREWSVTPPTGERGVNTALPARPPRQGFAELATGSSPPPDSAGSHVPDLAVTPGVRFVLPEAGVEREATSPPVEEKSRRHRIVDGDTLPKLAARYLGDRSRYAEIFLKNQQVLTDPRLLPVGAEIEIPPHLSAALEEGLPRPAACPRAEEQEQEGTATSPPAEEPSPVRGSDLAPIPPQALPPREG